MTRQTLRSGRNAAHGFTLIEMLAVILIIGVLMSMILGIVKYANIANLEAKAKADIETIRTALSDYQMDVGEFPPSATWTNNLTTPTAYIRVGFSFVDPWSQPYRYIRAASKKAYTLYSKGRDRDEGTDAKNADNIVAGKF